MEAVDELLEEIWIREEETKEAWQRIEMLCPAVRRYAQMALEDNLIEEREGKVRLTEKGRQEASVIIRSHRLAERVFSDLFDLEKEEVESSACKFEHLLSEAATDSICILLGHPRSCPHGKPIPPGECCRRQVGTIRPLVVPVKEMKPGEEGVIAYVGTQNVGRLTHLNSLGVFSGNRVKLIQRRPSYVIRVDETQLALDDRLAEEIYVKRKLG